MSPRNAHLFAVLLALSMPACVAPGAVNGGSFVNAQPAAGIPMVGAYDFDILDELAGRACVKRSELAGPNGVRYWFAGDGDRVVGEAAISAVRGLAILDALTKAKGIDTIFATRFIVTSKGDETCGEVFGRGIRYKKASRDPSAGAGANPTAASAPTPAAS